MAALLVTGPAQHNPAMVYLTGGGHLTDADLIKKRGEPAVLFHGPMERDEAARTGLVTRSYSELPLFATCSDRPTATGQQAVALRYQQHADRPGHDLGRVLLYGREEVGASFATFSSACRRSCPAWISGGDSSEALLPQAMATKSPDEVERIRQMGQVTTAVVGQTADFLTSPAARDGVLVKADGQPLTIGDVKRQINLWLAERGAENPEGTIFAIGRDAGVPHSSGNPEDILRLGQTIVFDIFPCEAGGGYFYDFTRTWCLGYAPDEAQAALRNRCGRSTSAS